MATNISGISSYQQTNQLFKSNQQSQTQKADQSLKNDYSDGKNVSDSNVKVSEWKPVSKGSSLVPINKEGYGTVVGNVELSDKAREYYDKLKSKFHGMDFILVSKDMKSQVEANASRYGNSLKPVVLIDDEKLEKMANDEEYRKKYEGIISMSQAKLLEAKNSLISSGANVKNFGMNVDDDGKISFFATIEKTNDAQKKVLEKRQAAKKAAKIKENKKHEKEKIEERIEKHKENVKALEAKTKEKLENKVSDDNDEEWITDDKEYIEFRSESIESLVSEVSRYAYENSANSVLSKAEEGLGQNIDFKG